MPALQETDGAPQESKEIAEEEQLLACNFDASWIHKTRAGREMLSSQSIDA